MKNTLDNTLYAIKDSIYIYENRKTGFQLKEINGREILNYKKEQEFKQEINPYLQDILNFLSEQEDINSIKIPGLINFINKKTGISSELLKKAVENSITSKSLYQ